MAKTGTASLTIAELREFASFTEAEQLFIERGLDVGLGRGDAFKQWSSKAGDTAAIRTSVPMNSCTPSNPLSHGTVSRKARSSR